MDYLIVQAAAYYDAAACWASNFITFWGLSDIFFWIH